MKTDEKSLWKWLKHAEEYLSAAELYCLHWQRVENSIDTDFPDVEGSYNGVGFVIELKSLALVSDLRRKLTPGQAMFLRTRARSGENAWLLVEIGGKKRYLFPGEIAPLFLNPCGVTENDLFSCSITLPYDKSITFFRRIVEHTL